MEAQTELMALFIAIIKNLWVFILAIGAYVLRLYHIRMEKVEEALLQLRTDMPSEFERHEMLRTREQIQRLVDNIGLLKDELHKNHIELLEKLGEKADKEK